MLVGLLFVDINDQFGVDGFGKEGLAKTFSLAPKFPDSYPLHLMKPYLTKYFIKTNWVISIEGISLVF